MVAFYNLIFYNIILLISTCTNTKVAAISLPKEDIEVSIDLYKQAFSLLSEFPQFNDSYRYSSENKVKLEVPMDFDLEYEKAKYQLDTINLTLEQTQAKNLLEQSSDLDNIDATFLLAEMNLYGNFSYPTNYSIALQYYHKVIELQPNATAYFNLAIMYSTGLFGELPIDQAKANIFYNSAFQQGDLRAAMVLGYRYLFGISVPRDFSTSWFYYQVVADNLKRIYDSAPLGGPNFDSFSIRVSDFQNGVYGKGVGDIGSSLQRSNSRFNDYLANNILESEETLYDELYYTVLKYYEGSYLRKRNYRDAFQLAKSTMEHGITQFDELSVLDRKYLSGCIYILGRMYLRGEGVTQNFLEALNHFNKSIDVYPLSESYNDLGLVYEYGPDHVRNVSKAFEMYGKSSNFSSHAGLYNYARLTIPKNKVKGTELMKRAVSQNLDIQAIYYTSDMLGLEHTSNRDNIVKNLKYYVEHFDNYVTSLEWALFEMIKGRAKNGLIGYAMAAEQGFETAQASMGFLLYQLTSILEAEPPNIPEERRQMALTYLTRSSMQFNIDSTVLLGDIYFANGEYDKAATVYETASTRLSSQGSFNLGWLYEQGIGVEKDFHLAKRYYDLSLLNHPKAYLPVQLALLRLRFKSFINKITGGKVNGIGKDSTHRTWSDWKALYRKIRGTNDQNIDTNVQEQLQQQNLDPDFTLGAQDILLIGLMFLPFGLIFLMQLFQQIQIRRRANGENVPAPNIQFDFRVIPI